MREKIAMLRAARLMPAMVGIGLILTALGLAAASARAGERFTPPINVSANEHVLCRVVNVTGAAHMVEIEARDGAGNPVAQASCFPGANPFTPFMFAGDVSLLKCAGPGPRYCHFTVVGAPETAIRGTMEARNNATLEVLAVLPAE